MLVTIQGKIIDTEKIYSISDIVSQDGISGFAINFLGGTTEDFNLDGFTSYLECNNITKVQAQADMSYWVEYRKDKVTYIQDAYNRICCARKRLIEYWNKSKSDIPEIII